MARFEYQARNQAGQLQVGFIEAENRDGAAERLFADNLYVLSLTEAGKKGVGTAIKNILNKVSQKDLMIFTRQFATLLESGTPLSESLRTLASQTRRPLLRETITEVQREIDSGLSLSQAMEKNGNVFSEFYVNMVRSAEVTGRVDEVMSFLADYLEKQTILVSKVRNALIYPVFMVLLLILVVVFMSVMVFPQIGSVFQELGSDLPPLTRAFIGFGKFLINWWWAALAGIGIAIFVFLDYFRSKEGKVLMNEIILRLPIANRMLKNMYVSRFADSVSVLTRGGVAIVQALEITARTIGSAVYGEILKATADEVKNGVPLSQALLRYPKYFPALVGQMLVVGERTGQTDTLLRKVSAFYGREVEDLVGSLVELIQPALMLVIGGVVGLLFASILTPIFHFIQNLNL
ncbi:MAG: type II secretion system F family protein [Parcubacteria group bacterium]